jgi:hypothetical protein
MGEFEFVGQPNWRDRDSLRLGTRIVHALTPAGMLQNPNATQHVHRLQKARLFEAWVKHVCHVNEHARLKMGEIVLARCLFRTLSL